MPLSYIPFQFPGVPNVACAFTGRAFGNVSLDFAAREQAPNAWEKTVQVRKSLATVFGFQDFAEVHQVHGVHTIFEPVAQSPDEPARIDADGMATTCPGLALMVKTADCQPILIAHESGRYVMALHSGWRGNRQDYPRLAVLEFCERYSFKPSELWAVRGPSLGPAASEFTNFDTEWGADFQHWYDGKNMDLWMLVRDQLASAGIQPRRILGLDICTYANPRDFFSFRQFCRNGHADGRQASLIWIC